jgi:hypothetical protein
MLETLGENTEGKGLDARNRFVPIFRINQDAREIPDFTDPSPVLFPLKLDSELHRVFRHGVKLTGRRAYCLTGCA